MWTAVTSDTKHITDYQCRRVTIDLARQDLRQEVIACQDMEDFLGGIGRSFKFLDDYEVNDAFAPSAPLISEFYQELRARVLKAFEEQIETYGLQSVA
jgi:hypothetical protein